MASILVMLPGQGVPRTIEITRLDDEELVIVDRRMLGQLVDTLTDPAVERTFGRLMHVPDRDTEFHLYFEEVGRDAT